MVAITAEVLKTVTLSWYSHSDATVFTTYVLILLDYEGLHTVSDTLMVRGTELECYQIKSVSTATSKLLGYMQIDVAHAFRGLISVAAHTTRIRCQCMAYIQRDLDQVVVTC